MKCPVSADSHSQSIDALALSFGVKFYLFLIITGKKHVADLTIKAYEGTSRQAFFSGVLG